jgi:hypothetical protein
MKINNWIDELRISKENTINKNQIMIIEVILLFIPQLKRNKDNKEVNKEPHSMLIDNRFDNVKDWKKLENDSSKQSINRKLDKEDRNRKRMNEPIIRPYKIRYNNTDINTAIIPKR